MDRLPHARFQEHPPVVFFEAAEDFDIEVAVELFAALALHQQNAAVNRQDVMHVGDFVDDGANRGFTLIPDTEKTREYGHKMVRSYNETVGHTQMIDEKHNQKLGAAFLRQATQRARRGY